MKVELTGITKEPLQPPTAAAGENSAIGAPGATVVMAQFKPVDGSVCPPFGGGVWVPYEIVAGAQVGDIFTLHLERAR